MPRWRSSASSASREAPLLPPTCWQGQEHGRTIPVALRHVDDNAMLDGKLDEALARL